MDNNSNNQTNRTQSRPTSSPMRPTGANVGATPRPTGSNMGAMPRPTGARPTGNTSTSPRPAGTPARPTSPNSTRPISSGATARSSTPMSAEDKLKRSMKGLSYTGSGSSGLGANAEAEKSKADARKKVGGVVLDMETIQDANKQKLQTKGRRNGVIILVLSLLLVASLVYLAVAIMNFYNSKKAPNCKYVVQGTADAHWIVEGGEKTEFVLRSGLKRDMIYVLDSQLEISTVESVSLSIEVKVLLEGEAILIEGLQEYNENLVRVAKTNKYVYQTSITGGGTIELFKGIDFSNAPNNLSSDNIEIEVIAYVDIVE